MENLKLVFGFTLIVMLSSTTMYSQKNDSILVKGVIVDDTGEPVFGVNVIQKGTRNGTITDINGCFELYIPLGVKIDILYLGFKGLTTKKIYSNNLKINISNGLIEFCCTNHSKSHCGLTTDEMQELTKKNNCSFK